MSRDVASRSHYCRAMRQRSMSRQVIAGVGPQVGVRTEAVADEMRSELNALEQSVKALRAEWQTLTGTGVAGAPEFRNLKAETKEALRMAKESALAIEELLAAEVRQDQEIGALTGSGQ